MAMGPDQEDPQVFAEQGEGLLAHDVPVRAFPTFHSAWALSFVALAGFALVSASRSHPHTKVGNLQASIGLQETVAQAAGADAQWDAQGFHANMVEARRSGNGVGALLREVATSNGEVGNEWQVPITQYISTQDTAGVNVPTLGRAPLVTFSGMTTADAMLHFGHERGGEKVCALNFANGKGVGGGYTMGSQAQEEDLCRRCPTLYTSLMNAKDNGFYPFGPGGGPAKYPDVLWTPDVTVARAGEQAGFELLPREQQVAVSMIAAAAPNLRFGDPPEHFDEEAMYQAIRNIFIGPRVKSPGTSTLILGAWGCGAFGGDPRTMAKLFTRAVKEDGLGNLYQEVHFAIPSFSWQDINGQIFKETFESEGVRFTEVAAK